MALGTQETLAALLALQQVDTQIARAKRAQAGLDNGTAAAEASVEAQAKAKAATDALHRAHGELRDAELKQEAVGVKRKQYTQRLYQGTITNAKELGNIEKEIELLGRQQSDLDTRILELMEVAEQTQADATVAEANAREAQTRHSDIVSQFQARYEALSLELTEATRQRAEAAASVGDPALLKRYDDIRVKHAGVGIAPIVEGDCGGCHMKLPSELVKAVKETSSPQICDNCGRLLVSMRT